MDVSDGNPCGLDAFPQEVIEHIAGYLCEGDGVGLARMAAVSRRWRWAVERRIGQRRLMDAPNAEARQPWEGDVFDECHRSTARQTLFRRALETDVTDLIVWLWRLYPRLWLWLACEQHGERCLAGRESTDLKMRAWSIASGAGSLGCLKWLAHVRWKRYGQDGRVLVTAAAAGHVRVLDWLHSMVIKTVPSDALVRAAVSGDATNDVDVLDWLRRRHKMTRHNVECILWFAALRDRVALVAWAIDRCYRHVHDIAGGRETMQCWQALVCDDQGSQPDRRAFFWLLKGRIWSPYP
ncbi:F-box incomplete domain containing protein [Pandoravirus quercus]|uniref:F-box incomplete domain containing protein n=1 Tax=Pandoravirus quercus TaxID=2107709 RepID=A0A2U7U9S0_9VIRU|nr:F-box incomplete domain containing protein [Pandoravirus quercus]AVK75176.1 F-box incomplete domain containing protein [Pandoravirus quercus]